MFFLPLITLAAPLPVNIKIAEYNSKLQFCMNKGGAWLFKGKKGKIAPNKLYTIKGELKEKAKINFHVIVGSCPADNESLLYELVHKYPSLKTYKFIIEKKPITGLKNDKIVYIGAGVFESEKEAKEYQNKLALAKIPAWIFKEIIKKAQGSFSIYLKNKLLCRESSSLRLQPRALTTLKKVEYAKGYSWHGYQNRSYSGEISLQWGAEGQIECVEHTDIEKLLVGIVPAEISAKSHPAALQAQAVAARCEILSKLGTRHYNEGFELCAEQHCQVYKGRQKTDEYIQKSIAQTAGVVLVGHDKRLIDAVYSANCGGHTSANHQIWVSNPNPHLQGVSDMVIPKKINLTNEAEAKSYIENPPGAWCSISGVEGSNNFRWRFNISKKDWKRVEEAAEVGKISFIGSYTREISGRIIELHIVGQKGEKVILKELPIRKLFGMLKSSCFVADFKRDENGFINEASFLGAGFGHGVGMCQTGAQAMAAAGYDYKRILLHYFAGAAIKKLY